MRIVDSSLQSRGYHLSPAELADLMRDSTIANSTQSGRDMAGSSAIIGHSENRCAAAFMGNASDRLHG